MVGLSCAWLSAGASKALPASTCSSAADADANFVLIEGGQIAEVQATAEGATYDEEGLLRLLRLLLHRLLRCHHLLLRRNKLELPNTLLTNSGRCLTSSTISKPHIGKPVTER